MRVSERGCVGRFQVDPIQPLFDYIVHDRAMLLLQLGIIFEISSKIRRHSNKSIELVVRFARQLGDLSLTLPNTPITFLTSGHVKR